MTQNTTLVAAGEVAAAARQLSLAGRWDDAARLLDAARATGDAGRAELALAAAEVAVERDWAAGTDTAAGRLAALGGGWDASFLALRRRYQELLFRDGQLAFGPDGRPPEALAALRRDVAALRDEAAGERRRGWAELYLGLIADNLFGERDAAPAHYREALRAGEAGDDLLAREALRHLGDHHHDDGDHERALAAWRRATELGARAGNVPGTLSQQLLLAVLARDAGDDAGAALLAGEIARWAGALGAPQIAAQAAGLVAGADPTQA